MELFPATRVTYLTMNVRPQLSDGTPNPLSDVKVRQALNHAIDKDAIIQIVTYGVGTKSQSYMSSTTPHGHGSKGPLYPYDPEKAKALLGETEWADGFEVSIYRARRQCRRDRDRFGGAADVEPARRQAQHRAGRQRHPHRALPGRRLPDAQLVLDQRHQRSEPDHLLHGVLPADRVPAFRLERTTRSTSCSSRASRSSTRQARAAQYERIQEIHTSEAPVSTCTRRPIRWRCRRSVEGFYQIPLGNNIFAETYIEK